MTQVSMSAYIRTSINSDGLILPRVHLLSAQLKRKCPKGIGYKGVDRTYNVST